MFQMLLVVACLSACQVSSAYDPSKSALLTEEKLRELDVLLANEVSTWDTNTARCSVDTKNPSAPFECRDAYFQKLASEGYEMADIVSRLFVGIHTVNDREAYERLHKLAEQGDKSALCFAQQIIPKLRDTGWPYTYETELKYTKQGKALGLPLCALNEYYLYWNGAVELGYPKDAALAHQRLLEAARAGLFSAQSALLFQYRLEGFDNLHTIRKALCWGRIAGHHVAVADFQGYIRDLVAAARDKDDQSKIIHPELEQLANEWGLRTTPYENKPTTPNECIQIEEEK